MAETPRRRKKRVSAPKNQPTVDAWLQPWSEPVRALKSEDVAKIRRDERCQAMRQAKAHQAALARAAKDRDKRELLAVVQQETGAGDPAKRLLPRVNKRLRRLKRNPISLSTLYRRLRELKKKK
jgi:hypothetical protein